MRPSQIIRAKIERHPIVRVSDLIDETVTRSSVQDAVARGDLVRLSHGVVGSPGMLFEGRIDDAVACLQYDAIICGRSAAMRHGLSDEAPDALELLVHSGKGRPPTSSPTVFRRTSAPAAFTYDVEVEMVGGVAVRMTGRARTVVDQYRFGVSEQHVLQSLHTYLGEGGNGNALQAACRALHPGLWGRIARDVANVGLARDRAYSREDDHAPDGEQDDDHAGGPAFLRGGP